MFSPNRAYFELEIDLLNIVPFETSKMEFSFGYTMRMQESLSPGTSEFIDILNELGKDESVRRHNLKKYNTPFNKSGKWLAT
jgi:hypothetical protein